MTKKLTKDQLYHILQEEMTLGSHLAFDSGLKILKPILKPGMSVLDFGCGRGDWLKAAIKLGAKRVLGLETYALNKPDLPYEVEFQDITEPIFLGETFDIAICVEVAEHIPTEKSDILVENIANSANIIAWSAACPGQGGCFHINEQKPLFWHEKFLKQGFICVDLRSLFWDDKNIEPWYRQGILFYFKEHLVPYEFKNYIVNKPMHLIHPDVFFPYSAKDEHIIYSFDDEKNLIIQRFPFDSIED